MGFKVLEVQGTPNPNAMKFILDGRISEGPVSFLSAEAGRGHVVAERLFQVEGVASLLLLGDFVTVNKRAEAKWGVVRTGVVKALSTVTAT